MSTFIQFDALHSILAAIIVGLVSWIMMNTNLTSSKLNHTPQVPVSQMVDFLLIIGKLKQEKRTGWVNNKVPLPESIADHQYRMAVMGWVIRDQSRNPQQTATVALVHDLAEALVGDITPPETSGVAPKDKHAMEDAAMQTISETLQIGRNLQLSNELKDLYNQYNMQTTPEGRFCKQLDKLEMLIQAFEYETINEDKDLSPFYHSAAKGIKDPYLIEIQNEVLKRRRELKGCDLTPK